MKAKLLDDCFLHDKDRLLHAEALAILKERLQPIVDTETVTLLMLSGDSPLDRSSRRATFPLTPMPPLTAMLSPLPIMIRFAAHS